MQKVDQSHLIRRRGQLPRSSSNLSNASSSDGDAEEDIPEEKYKHKPVSLRSVGIRAATASTLALICMGLIRAGHFYCILVGRFIYKSTTLITYTLQMHCFCVILFRCVDSS